MKQTSTSTFSEGLNFDLNPITTPNNVLTDAVNATFLTLNGDELVLQNDAGNTSIDILYSTAIPYVGLHDNEDIVYTEIEDVRTYYKNISGTINDTSLVTNTTNWYELPSGKVTLSSGFYPLGIKEYGGILYIISAKLPTVLAKDVPRYENITYDVGTIVYENINEKTFYKKKKFGEHSLPLETDENWEVLGSEQDYNNSEGFVEIGSYPSPDVFVFSQATQFVGNDVVIGNDSLITTNFKWINTGNTECEIIELNNTGYLLVEKKEQSYIDGVWTDTGNTKIVKEVNTVICSIPLYAAYISVSPDNYSIPNEEVINYILNSDIQVLSPILSGFNYLFFSIPFGKTLKVLNSINQDITSSFTNIGTDERVGYYKNSIYKKNDMFSTQVATKFTIKIY